MQTAQEQSFEDEVHEEDISVEEVRNALQKMKNGKTQGEDKLSLEIIQALEET